MTFRYIGSKSRLVMQIARHIGQPPSDDAFFVDPFCGTGAVALTAAKLGWNIRLNDILASAVTAAAARLTSADQAKFEHLGGYESAIKKLNASKPKLGFIYGEYSPASIHRVGFERRYFTEANAAKIDGMREKIKKWKKQGDIDSVEERLLIADLFGALNRVANIAGTFGCFLSKWTTQSQESIAVRSRELLTETIRVETMIGDVFEVPNKAQDLVYLDPPYTKRQYASYYHILETVALGDEPPVTGVAGLRPWRDQASDFCYKSRALTTLSRLVQSLKAERILLSYSSEGHICMADMKVELSKYGKSVMHPLGAIGRYRPNKVASSAGSDVNEFLVSLERLKGLSGVEKSVKLEPTRSSKMSVV